MGDAFEAITQTMREIISRVDNPLIAGPVVRLLQHAVSSDIPHGRVVVPIRQPLSHTEKSRLWFIFAVAHVAEFLEVRFDIRISMFTAESRAVLLPTTLQLEVCITAMADIGLSKGDQLLRQLVQLPKVIAGIRDGMRGESKPLHDILDRVEIFLFLGLGVGVVESNN